MASNDGQDTRNPSTPPQSIPLQDLSRPPDFVSTSGGQRSHNRGRSLLSGGSNGSGGPGARYARLDDTSPSPTLRISMPASQYLQPKVEDDDNYSGSPVDNPHAFQMAMVGLTMPEPAESRSALHVPHRSYGSGDFDDVSPFSQPYEDSDTYFQNTESDQVRLTDPTYLQPISGAPVPTTPQPSGDRTSFQSVRVNSPEGRSYGSRLGDNISSAERPSGRSRSRSYGNSLTPESRRVSRSPSSASPLTRAGSMMRAMSQRVVNFSNDAEFPDQVFRKKDSMVEEPPYGGLPYGGLPPIHLATEDTGYHPEILVSPVEKMRASPMPFVLEPVLPPPWPETNPLRGKSLGIFPPDSYIRMRLSEFLVHPITEPAILVLIVLQTVLLAVESSNDVYTHPQANTWSGSPIDFAMVGLFVIYTLEIAAKIIVSGFFFNAVEYSTRDAKERGLKATIQSKYKAIFGPQRQPSMRAPRHPDTPPLSQAITHSLTKAVQTTAGIATTVEEQQRNQLARRAFLRHSMNRIDFVAIVSFWISFALGLTGVEAAKHLYVYRMLSCLRILRLLWITNGTSIILKSLKKAAPLLVNVSFLIGFFWLLFAIVGIQAFKSSFSRSCVWIDPLGKSNYTNNMTLCGGHLDTNTGQPHPWVHSDGTTPGALYSKGYICPRGSLCMEQQSLYNGTVSFDNIVNSLELVFVIMSANTFTDLMYLTTNSDYLASALFFAAGIVIMMLWLTNLLIAVITSSFQVIREESKQSAFTAINEPLLPAEEIEIRNRKSSLQTIYDKTYWFWILVIVFGLICQSVRSASMSQFRSTFITVTETVVTFLLLGDILFRAAADWRRFHRSYRNIFDAAIAIITTVILIPPIRNSGQPYAWLTAFQIIRIYRVVWAVPITRDLIAKVLGNATGIINLVLFVFLITFLVAILAVQLFRGDIPTWDDNNGTVRTTFFSIWNAFLGMYQILSSENWTSILYNVTSYNNHLNTGWMGAAFLIAWFILAYFILVNMFIAVIQENFDVSEDEKRLQQVKAFLQKKEVGSSSSNLSLSTIFRLGRSRKIKDPLDFGQSTMEMLLKDAVVRDFLDEESDTPHRSALDPSTTFDTTPNINPGPLSNLWGKFINRVWNREPNPFYSSIQFTGPGEGLDPRAMAKEAVSATSHRKKAQREYLARHPNYNNSLFIFTPTNPIRRFCQKIVGPGRGFERFEGVEPNKVVWYSFSAFIYAAIVTMVVLACVTTPLYQRDYFKIHQFSWENWFVWTDMAFACIFTIEAVIKVIADGAFWTPNAYFRSLWGFIDGLVLVTLWINVITSFLNDGAISRAVGAFKALRALRLLHISDSARDTFHSVIFVGGWRVLSAAFVSLSLLIPFAIYGVNLFNGQLMICNDGGSNITNLSDCSGEWLSTPFSNEWQIPAPRVASNPFYDFDNFGDSLFILFQIVSQEGWIDVMWSAESIMGRGLQPQDFASQGNAIFFVIFNLLATVFVLTLFISVFMRTYTEQTGVAFLTAEQRSWMELRKLLRQVAPSKRPSTQETSKWKKWCYRKAVEKHGVWTRTVTIILALHLILLMLEYYPEPNWWVRTRDFIFLFFTLFYTANIVIRLVGLSWSRFRRSSWDIYSLVSVSGTIITTVLLLSNYNSVTYYQLHKLFLVSIALMLIPRNNALDQLFKTAAASLTSIGNLLATWLILFLVYAIAMTQTFGLTRFGTQGTNNLNFRDVPRALIVLFRMSVGEGWNQIMEDYATIQPPLCVDTDLFFNSDCGSSTWARALFISWNILSMYIFVSLFVSLIYESFSYVYQQSSGHAIVNRDETRRFKQAWATLDPDGTGYITKEEFPRLLGELSGVFAMRIYEPEDSIHRILEDVQLQAPNSRTASIATTSAATGIDLQKLNARIAQIDGKKVRERRRVYNIFYEEVMVSADPDRGISFLSVLMILAHYNIISDNKSLKLDEFLRRRARLQRVEEEVSRRVVVGFFDTLYHRRKFLRYMDRHNTQRMTDIPQFEVPEIIVENEDDSENEDPSQKMRATVDFTDRHHSWRDAFGFDGHSRISSLSGSGPSSPSRSPRLRPHRPGQSVDLSDTIPDVGHSRRGSSVTAEAENASTALEAFNDSAWGESLRRSFTMRRPGERGS